MEAIRTFERNHPNKPQAPALVRSLPGASVGGSSLRPAGTLPSLKLLLARSAQGKPGGARTGPRPGGEAAGAGVPKRTEKASEAPRDRLRAWRGPTAAPPPWGVAMGTKGLASQPPPGRVRPFLRAESGGPEEAADTHLDAGAATRRSSAASGRVRQLGGRSRRPFPLPPLASPAPLPSRTRSRCPSAPERGGVGLRLREAGDLNPAAWRAQKPRCLRRLGLGASASASAFTPFRLSRNPAEFLEETPRPSLFLLSRIPLHLMTNTKPVRTSV